VVVELNGEIASLKEEVRALRGKLLQVTWAQG
jgi:hypothetical protein